MPLGISSKGVDATYVDATYMEGYWAGKQQREAEITNIINKQQEFKQRVSELEKSKKKHKLRAMTNKECCNKWLKNHNDYAEPVRECPLNEGCSWCYECGKDEEPRRLPNGKYILIEVKE